MSIELTKTLNEYAALVDGYFVQCLPKKDCLQQHILEAMEYSLLSGGKRLRAALLLEMYRIHGGEVNRALPFACALEMIHAYSLIHDDLPCMDDDDLRRGKPSSHKVYGEAMAVLAGDGLLNCAFEVMAAAPGFSPEIVLRALGALAAKSGARGMIGGQVLDMSLEDTPSPARGLHETMVELKTAALFEAACSVGCILADCSAKTIANAALMGRLLGVMFQLSDDILDVVSTDEILGKPIGSDVQQGKCTYITLYGLDRCCTMLEEQASRVNGLLKELPPSDLLSGLAQWIVARQN